MSTETDQEDQTQPIRVQADRDLSEDTSRIILAHPKPEPAEDIPGWLLEFASQPTEEADFQIQHGLEAIEEPAPEPIEAINPIVLETAEWHVVQGELENPVLVPDISDKQNLTDKTFQDLISLGDYAAVADLIRKTATTKELAEASQRALRSHLVLQEDRMELWNVYDELTKRINLPKTEIDSMEDEWNDL